MKKFLFVIVAILAVVSAMAISYGGTTALGKKTLIMTGTFKASDIIVTYNAAGTTYTAGSTFGLIDAANTTTATGAWKVTLTAGTCFSGNVLTKLGNVTVQQNASGYGTVQGVTFTSGVVVDPAANTISVILEGL